MHSWSRKQTSAWQHSALWPMTPANKPRPPWEGISIVIEQLQQSLYLRIPGLCWYLGTPVWQFLVSSKAVTQWGGWKWPRRSPQLSSDGAHQVLQWIFAPDLSSQQRAVQGGLPQVKALLQRALNEVEGAAGKMPQDLSEAEKAHTSGCKTSSLRQSDSLSIAPVYGTSQCNISQ